jgi:hypothetical protein
MALKRFESPDEVRTMTRGRPAGGPAPVTAAAILWRRLDAPGHDACRLVRSAGGWRIEGTAVFRHLGAPASLAYRADCDLEWRARQGRVRGWLGDASLDLAIARTGEAGWTLDGAAVPGLADCLDLDFGFTPATNLLQIRRLALEEGQAADAPAAWLDVATGGLQRLPQRYQRRAGSTYWYEAPSFGYAALLEVDPSGFVRLYPELWEAESSPASA